MLIGLERKRGGASGVSQALKRNLPGPSASGQQAIPWETVEEHLEALGKHPSSSVRGTYGAASNLDFDDVTEAVIARLGTEYHAPRVGVPAQPAGGLELSAPGVGVPAKPAGAVGSEVAAVAEDAPEVHAVTVGSGDEVPVFGTSAPADTPSKQTPRRSARLAGSMSKAAPDKTPCKPTPGRKRSQVPDGGAPRASKSKRVVE